MSMLKRVLLSMALVVSLLGGFSAVQPSMAVHTMVVHAAGCYDSGCNDQDPVAKGCVDDAQRIGTATVLTTSGGDLVGTLALFYSPSCGAVYMAFFNQSSVTLDIEMDLVTHNESNGQVIYQLPSKTYVCGQSQETDTGMLGVGSGLDTNVYGHAHVTNYPSVNDGYVGYAF